MGSRTAYSIRRGSGSKGVAGAIDNLVLKAIRPKSLNILMVAAWDNICPLNPFLQASLATCWWEEGISVPATILWSKEDL